MAKMGDAERLLLISNSTLHGNGYLDHAGEEIREIVAGTKPGRESKEEITIFDSTGMALQDVAAAAVLFEKAQRQGAGVRLNFAA